MRLINLKISAFGPYCDEQVIDFNLINNKKLFLITGPTGSGKTSIFDAIAFALYGESSGNERKADDFRSHFASIDQVTFVYLEFEIKGNKYIVYREPKQEKKKSRGEGVTVRGPEATLTVNNDKIYVGVSEVNHKILEVLGISYEQFRQIVMLPQGEFRKLLEANSIEREEIFRKIFKTESFKLISEKLKIKTKELENTIGNTKTLINNNINKLIVSNDLLSIINQEYRNYDEIIRQTKIYNEKLSEELFDLKQKVKKIQENIFNIGIKITEAKVINEKFSERTKLITTKQSLINQENDIKHLEKKISKATGAKLISEIDARVNRLMLKINESNINLNHLFLKRAELNNELIKNDKLFLEKQKEYLQISKLKESLFSLKEIEKKYLLLFEKNKNLTLLKEKYLAFKAELQKTRASLEEFKHNLNENIKLLDNYVNLENELNDKKIQRKDYELLLLNLSNIIVLCSEINELKKRHENYTIIFEQRNNEYKQNKTYYEQQLELFLKNQAGILASKLVENEPCPVCGSLVHPNKGKLLLDVLSSEQLEKVNDIVIKYEEGKNLIYEELLKTYTELTEKVKLLNDLGNTVNDNDINYTKEEHYKQLYNNNLIIVNDLDCSISLLNKKIQEKLILEKLINDLKTKLIVLESNYEKKVELFGELEKEYLVNNKIINDIENDLNNKYFSYDSVLKELNILTTKITNLESEYTTLQTKVNNLEKDYEIINNSIENEQVNLGNLNFSLSEETALFDTKLKAAKFISVIEYKGFLIDELLLNEWQNSVDLYYKDLDYVSKMIIKYNDELNDKQEVNIFELNSKHSQLNIELDKLNEQVQNIVVKLQNNLSIMQDLEKLYHSFKDKINQYELISSISKVANGDNSEKLTFERFVLAAYFDEIIYAANLRLQDMTCSRYILLRKDGRGKGASQQGLDLEVLDNYTSKIRNVKTLSGGEAFIASLALALGLADVVLSYSGGIALDTIFIDEGFGSLDPEALEHAINTLINIEQSGRLVGIISHVEELKERIAVKLEITPSKDGSALKIVL